MLVYITYLKKGETQMEKDYKSILQEMLTDIDLEEYNQALGLKKQDLYNRGKHTELKVYDMVTNYEDMQTISKETGFAVHEIWGTIKDICLLIHFVKKQGNKETTSNQVKVR